MRLDDLLVGYTSSTFEGIDVLCEDAEEFASVVKEREEVVGGGGEELPGVERLGEGEEGLRLCMREVCVLNAGEERQVVKGEGV